MSLKTLPLLFINLGGEMMYILDQRLRAQNIADEKAKKVLHDIVQTMFNKRFMEELFKPQTLYSKKAMRTMFDRIAHASIMRLNAASMDKLYDLMTMAFKYQVSLALRPNDILLITFNHMDAIRSYVESSATIRQQVDNVYSLLIQTFVPMSTGEFSLVRQTLLSFFQDMHIRVSIFLKDKVQNNNGRFVKRCVVLTFDEDAKVVTFDEDGKVVAPENVMVGQTFNSTEFLFNLLFKLYVIFAAVFMDDSLFQDSAIPDPMAKAHLELLCQLIGANVTKKHDFRLNLFNTDAEEEEAAKIKPVEMAESQVVKIDASKKVQCAQLSQILGELAVEDSNSQDKGDNLLDLMDSA
ncbi:protein OSCP1-like [Gigantopelta aegis]|uniref:protein OSCP1-like n=1 Tax=Gigantopelta aegis TaxID=1735272 RepID=UPI001B88D981|nr:protein OSCP1-like [Gigantopelta aegis]